MTNRSHVVKAWLTYHDYSFKFDHITTWHIKIWFDHDTACNPGVSTGLFRHGHKFNLSLNLGVFIGTVRLKPNKNSPTKVLFGFQKHNRTNRIKLMNRKNPNRTNFWFIRLSQNNQQILRRVKSEKLWTNFTRPPSALRFTIDHH